MFLSISIIIMITCEIPIFLNVTGDSCCLLCTISLQSKLSLRVRKYDGSFFFQFVGENYDNMT